MKDGETKLPTHDEAKRIDALLLDVVAYLCEDGGYTMASDGQIMYMVRLLLMSSIEKEHSLAVHLMLNPNIKVLFKRLRTVVNEQKEAQAVADLSKVAHDWAVEMMGNKDKVPPGELAVQGSEDKEYGVTFMTKEEALDLAHEMDRNPLKFPLHTKAKGDGEPN